MLWGPCRGGIRARAGGGELSGVTGEICSQNSQRLYVTLTLTQPRRARAGEKDTPLHYQGWAHRGHWGALCPPPLALGGWWPLTLRPQPSSPGLRRLLPASGTTSRFRTPTPRSGAPPAGPGKLERGRGRRQLAHDPDQEGVGRQAHLPPRGGGQVDPPHSSSASFCWASSLSWRRASSCRKGKRAG